MYLTIFLVSCFDNDPITPKDDPNPPNLRALATSEVQLVDASNDFAFNLTKAINAGESSNFFISPLSVGYALGMTSNGAVGPTKEGIKSTLDVSEMSDEEVNQAYKDLTALLLTMDKKVLLSIANSIWYKQDLTVKSEFEQAMEDYYNASVTGLDFSDPASKDVINGWIEEKTNDLIKDMLDRIPPDAVMYLVNAIYFKADWQYEFDEGLTSKAPFHFEDGSIADVDMMVSEGVKASYYNSQDYQFIEIPYGNGQYVMDVFLPSNDVIVREIIEGLDADTFNSIIEDSDTITLKLHLPKFKFGFKKLLNDDLINMGMELAFTPDAQFTEFFEDAKELMISRVIHQSMIEVNEVGSEAAAATIVEIIETSAGGGPLEVLINRPFFFLIREKHSNSILFSGKLMDPSV